MNSKIDYIDAETDKEQKNKLYVEQDILGEGTKIMGHHWHEYKDVIMKLPDFTFTDKVDIEKLERYGIREKYKLKKLIEMQQERNAADLGNFDLTDTPFDNEDFKTYVETETKKQKVADEEKKVQKEQLQLE